MKLKSILASSLIAAVGFSAMAVPAKRGTFSFQQSDGSQINVALFGDEHFHSFLTTDGLTVAQQANGDFCYVSAAGLTNVLAHNPEKRTVSEIGFLKQNENSFSLSSLFEAGKDKNTARRAKSVATRAGASQVPNNGAPRIPILLVQYKDVKFKDSDPKATFTEFFESGEKSARQYFIDQSNGKYTPQFDVYGPVTLSKNRVYYGGNDSSGYDLGVGNMAGEAAKALDSQIDYSLYDNDGDGECDVLIILYAGVGEASSGVVDSVWPCQWDLLSSEYNRVETLDKTIVNKFAVFNELNGEYKTKIDGIGTFCHEFSHCLGLPDFYDTDYSGNYFGMADWSLMDYGCYNDDGYTPIGYSAYEKEFMGWIKIEEGKENKKYTLPVFNSKDADSDVAIKLTNPKDKDEYFILENRQQQGWDKFMPASGMLITHVTFNQRAWDENIVNNYSPQRMTPVPADNSLALDPYSGAAVESDLAGDLWPYKGNSAFTDTSKPSAKVNSGGYLGKPVTEITANGDGTISLWVMKGFAQTLDTPEALTHVLNSTSEAEISWTSPHVGEATFTLELKEYEENVAELVLSTVFDNKDDLGGWINDGYCEVEEINKTSALRFGSSKQDGVLTSPEINTVDDGLISVKFNAMYYSKDHSEVSVSIVNERFETIDEAIVPLSASFEDYCVLLKGKGSSKVNVVFSTTAKKKRFYLASVEVYTGDATETRAEEKEIHTFEGLEGTSHIVTGLKEGGKYYYRIKAVPVSSDDFNESDWSERKILDLSEFNISSVVDEIVDETVESLYFTLDGLRVARPSAPGVYIVKKGSKTSKMILR